MNKKKHTCMFRRLYLLGEKYEKMPNIQHGVESTKPPFCKLKIVYFFSSTIGRIPFRAETMDWKQDTLRRESGSRIHVRLRFGFGRTSSTDPQARAWGRPAVESGSQTVALPGPAWFPVWTLFESHHWLSILNLLSNLKDDGIVGTHFDSISLNLDPAVSCMFFRCQFKSWMCFL